MLLVLQGVDELRRLQPPGGGGPHFVIIDVAALTEIVVAPAPSDALLAYAMGTTGRSAFSPFQPRGSLAGGSGLFVGRENVLDAILGSLDGEDHLVLGRPGSGRTSLLQTLAVRAHARTAGRDRAVLLIRLAQQTDVAVLYDQIRSQLAAQGHADLADRLAAVPTGDHSALSEVLGTLAQDYGQPVLLLLDDMDAFIDHDRETNSGQFLWFLRRRLAQAQPRICTIVLTALPTLAFSRVQPDDVFNGFCRAHSLLGIDPEGIGALVALLEAMGIEIAARDEVLALVRQGTYGLPGYVQLFCDQLLLFADHTGQRRIGPADVRQVLARDIAPQIKAVVWDGLGAALPGSGSEVQTVVLKQKVLLLATVLSMVEPTEGLVPSPSADTSRSFSAADAVDFVRRRAPALVAEAWQLSESEATLLLRQLSATLAVGPADDSGGAYLFPAWILPEVLGAAPPGAIDDRDLPALLDSLVSELREKLLTGH